MSRSPTSSLTALLPAIRGTLADPAAVEGRYRLKSLKMSVGPAEVIVASGDTDALVSALRGGAGRVESAGLGMIEQVMPGTGDVAVVTGGAGGLGLSVAEELAGLGAHIALMDIAEGPVTEAAERLGGIGLACDVTDPAAVEAAIERIVMAYGGIDILISNAGAAHSGALLELDDARFQKAFALNFWSHHYVARAVVRVMKLQGTGGALVFNVSKQAVNPGPDFGAYGVPKAALMALMRQYAVEHGKEGITSNAVNADRIRTGLMTQAMVDARSKARGLTPDAYMRGNLVQREVTGKDVAEAFVFLARARASTGAVISVDGGNVAAMMR